MPDVHTMFPQLSPAWQVQVWEHPDLRTGCLSSVTTGKAREISFSLAGLLRSMTGAVSCDDIASHSPQLGPSPEAAREVLEELVKHLSGEGIVESFATPKPARFFPPPVFHYHRLRILQLQLTNRCNLRCFHCYADSDGQADKGLPGEVIRQLVDEFASLGGIKLFLTGGEALLRRDLEDIVAYAKSRYLFVYLSTNGYAVTPERAERLVRLGVGAVNFSLDGSDAVTHDTFRQKSGSFQRVLNAVDAFLAQNITCGVQTTLHKNNLTQGAEILNLLRPKGVADCFFVRMMPQGRAARHDDLIPTMEEYRLAVREVYRTRRVRYQESVYPQTDDLQKPSTRCSAAISQMYVRADGSCFACPSLETDALVLGRYPESSLEEIWTQSTGPLVDLRDFDPNTIEQCRGCEHQRICKGGCAGNALRYHGDWTKADPHFCVTMDVRKEVDAIPIAAAAS